MRGSFGVHSLVELLALVASSLMASLRAPRRQAKARPTALPHRAKPGVPIVNSWAVRPPRTADARLPN